MKTTLTVLSTCLIASSLLTACGGSSNNGRTNTETPDITVPSTYTFQSRFSTESSVVYSGQIARQVLIQGLTDEIGSGLADKISSGLITSSTSVEDVIAILDSYYTGGTAALADEPITITTTPATLQATYGDISSNADLVSKTAGNDSVTDHRNWTGGDFKGWDAASPQALIQEWFGIIAANAVAQANGEQRVAPGTGAPLTIYQTDDGLDLKQLVQKFLLGAITFSQGTDDYLDDDVSDKGLRTDNTQPAGDTNPYTALEHQFDEGFGYFGAARNYNDYTDNEIAGSSGRDEFSSGYNDANGDGRIDLMSEFNFGASTNAAKRDRGSSTGTDFTKTVFDNLLAGRALISGANDALTDAQMTELKGYRDTIVSGWEKALAATVVHYINDTLGDMASFGTDDYSYSDHVKHWGEMKGFALGLQFNPRSPLHAADGNNASQTQFETFHALVSNRPVLATADEDTVAAYANHLQQARDLLQAAYGFAAEDVANW